MPLEVITFSNNYLNLVIGVFAYFLFPCVHFLDFLFVMKKKTKKDLIKMILKIYSRLTLIYSNLGFSLIFQEKLNYLEI